MDSSIVTSLFRITADTQVLLDYDAPVADQPEVRLSKNIQSTQPVLSQHRPCFDRGNRGADVSWKAYLVLANAVEANYVKTIAAQLAPVGSFEVTQKMRHHSGAITMQNMVAQVSGMWAHENCACVFWQLSGSGAWDSDLVPFRYDATLGGLIYQGHRFIEATDTFGTPGADVAIDLTKLFLYDLATGHVDFYAPTLKSLATTAIPEGAAATTDEITDLVFDATLGGIRFKVGSTPYFIATV